ncbi:MAG: DNA mismatch repair endonuclease MutL [Treponema sp.]|nr:DNA mismatch repair endonuclease MutL [Treponema sp.]
MAVRQLDSEVARKIAAGEVIDRPASIVREMMDNAVDSGASKIDVEIEGGGIDKIRIRDNGCGMSREDLEACARPHATSKIQNEDDLLNLTTLGFRGEALSSMAAVSRLQIMSGQWRMNVSSTENHILTPCPPITGTIVQTAALFENFPARRSFLKRPASEAVMCRNTFIEKALPRPDISFSLTVDGEEKLRLPVSDSLAKRFTEGMELYDSADLFYEIKGSSGDRDHSWSFTLVIGEPSVFRSNRKDIYIYVNGRRISEYSLVQAIEYGCTGFFPNGSHPVACLFAQVNPSLVDFNIHPAKKEAKFKDLAPLHHAVSSQTRNFFRQYGLKNAILQTGSYDTEHSFQQGGELEIASPGLWEKTTVDRPLDNIPLGNMGNSPRTAFRTGASYRDIGRGSHFPRASGHDGDTSSSPFYTKDFMQGWQAISERTSPPASAPAFPDGDDVAQFKPNYVESPGEDTGGVRYVGSALGTFIIAQKEDTLYIIDQHAAHERYLYDRIMEDAGQKQELLVPYTVRTESAADDNYLEAMKDKLAQAGFTGSKKEDGVWEFTSVPVRWKGNEADLAKDILDRRISPSDMINAVAASTACRSAVMDGTVLDSSMAAWLCTAALELPDPHCPHGRPVYTTITRRQLFDLVRRT